MASSSYSALLEKIRNPQPSLQKLAVIALFDKYRSGPPSDAARDAISRCLRSASPAVVDQSARELCRLVKDSKLDIQTALLELQSALDDSSSKQFASVFIKAIGSLTRLGFQKNPASFRFQSSENHPFVKVLCCGDEAQVELVKQVTVFIVKCNYVGMDAVSEFLRPFLNYLIIKVPHSKSNSAFLMNLVNAMAAFCCGFPTKGICLFNLLTSSLKYFPSNDAGEVLNICYVIECIADSYLVVLRQLVGMGSFVDKAQLCGVVFLQGVLSLHGDFRSCSGAVEKILNVTRQLLAVQKDLGLTYVSELSSVTLSLFHILTQAELEYEQHSVLAVVLLLIRWKTEYGYLNDSSSSDLNEEILLIFPVIELISSPSRSVKQSAADLLSVLGRIAADLHFSKKEKQEPDWKNSIITTRGQIAYRFLRNSWFHDQLPSRNLLYVDCYLDKVHAGEHDGQLKQWTFSVREYLSGFVKKSGLSTTFFRSEDIFPTEISMIVCSVASVLLLQQTKGCAMDVLAMCSSIAARFGVPLFLIILFYNHVFSTAEKNQASSDLSVNLLGMLPSIASHPAMIPLLLQFLLPMIHTDANPVIKATSVRLLCKTWEINDCVFETLQGMLEPNGMLDSAERNLSVCIAVSIRDVCKKNPDRGVDIILSIAACIKNDDPLVQSLGLQGLAHLCEADVIDFYTAWDVIANDIQNYMENPIVAHSLCLLLRWGATDVEAYPESGSSVLNVLWDIGTHTVGQSSLWTKAHAAAFAALSQYEVDHIQRCISDFGTRNFEFLIAGPETDLLEVLEEFQAKIINKEHINRRRYVKEKVVPGFRSKIFKLLDVVPGVIFRSEGTSKTKGVPGAALFFSPSHENVERNRSSQKGILYINREYEDSAEKIGYSLDLSRNVILALFSLQSWEAFTQRWMRSCIIEFEEKANHRPSLDRSLEAANYILKTLTRIAEEGNPRSAENVVLAIGAFCLVLPPSAHAIKSSASNFLLSWLYQHEHEHRQWPTAISLGLVSSCLHVTDHELKMRIINALIEVASKSKSSLLGGACGIGLGFSCQDLLTSSASATHTPSEKDLYGFLERKVLRKIVWTLVHMICRFNKISATIIEKLEALFPEGNVESSVEPFFHINDMNQNHAEEDVAGLIIGLGNSLGALYRAGAIDVVLYLKNLIFSWIPTADIPSSVSFFEEPFLAMSALGACLATPAIVSFCQKVEMIEDTDLKSLLDKFIGLISGLLSMERFDAFHQSLLMASCAGAGSIISISLNSGLCLESQKHLLSLFKRTYTSPRCLIVLGGMLGVINSMGVAAGTMAQVFSLNSVPRNSALQELTTFLGPSSHALETELIFLIQEMFLLAQNSVDPEIRDKSAWAISFLRHYFFSRIRANDESAAPSSTNIIQSGSQGVAENGVVMKLSLWLTDVNYSKLCTGVDIKALALCFRCLSHAPRLPPLDWRTVVSQCMRYGGQVAESSTLREECFVFMLPHASSSDSLLSFLDELYEFARFKSLESNLQSLMLLHVADLFRLFSNARLARLFDDMTYLLRALSSSEQHSWLQGHSLRVSFWKGLAICMKQTDLETKDFIHNFEKFMSILFTTLPWPLPLVPVESYQKCSKLEWCEAIKCLGKARLSWLLDLLLVPNADFCQHKSEDSELLKKLYAKIMLVRESAIPALELAKLRPCILNINSEVVWSILVEVSLTLLKLDEAIRRQWLVGTVEILCVTRYPSTALRFLGLLTGSCCKYMPILAADKEYVLSDLPVTISSLMETSSWGAVRESVALYVWRATERVHDWADHVEHGAYLADSQPIDETESSIGALLLQVMHQVCVSLKRYLPADKLLKLSNMAGHLRMEKAGL